MVHFLNKGSDFVCVEDVCLEYGTFSLAPVQITGVRVDVLVRRVTPEGVENRLDVDALGVGDNQSVPDMREYG